MQSSDKMSQPEQPGLTPSAGGSRGAHPFLDKEQGKIRRLFDGIAPRYDFLNHLLSFHMDKAWRRVAISELEFRNGALYLDACCGTGDLSFALEHRLAKSHPRARVIGADFSLSMLAHGTRKRRLDSSPRFVAGDTLQLPFDDRVFLGATVGFGIRNVEDLPAGLSELRRVLRRGGRLVLLEFTPVDTPVIKQCMDFYCHQVLPRIGNLVSGTRDQAYSYLQQSIDRWPNRQTLARRMSEVGFKAVKHRRLFPGNVAVHSGYA